MIYILVAVICIALLVLGGKLNKDKDYTVGKGMYKKSDYFFDDDDNKSKDANDFDYWNRNQLK